MINSNNIFFPQADLMIDCLPHVFKETCFALKGGTAINLFYRDLPRLSVDIDLVYLPTKNFIEAQSEISNALNRISAHLKKAMPKSMALKSLSRVGQFTQKLNFQVGKLSVVIEPNLVLRGTLDQVHTRSILPSAEALFQKSTGGNVLSEDEVYAGKFCAALDRQHPRDLFDIRIFLEGHTITPKLKSLFIAYLLCGGKPIHDVLFPNLNDISLSYERDFKHMTHEVVPLNDLLETRTLFIKMIHSSLTSDDKKFILSFNQCEPDWSLLGIAGTESFAAIVWKLKHLALFKAENPTKYHEQHQKLVEKMDK